MTKQNIKAAVNETTKKINWMGDINLDTIHVLPFQSRKEKVREKKRKGGWWGWGREGGRG